jgi:hypothetical protein
MGGSGAERGIGRGVEMPRHVEEPNDADGIADKGSTEAMGDGEAGVQVRMRGSARRRSAVYTSVASQKHCDRP